MNILAINFKSRKLTHVSETKKDLENYYRDYENKLSDYLHNMKDALTDKQYLQALEAISSVAHYRLIRNAKVLFYIDGYLAII
jgi:hypothetical protein